MTKLICKTIQFVAGFALLYLVSQVLGFSPQMRESAAVPAAVTGEIGQQAAVPAAASVVQDGIFVYAASSQLYILPGPLSIIQASEKYNCEYIVNADFFDPGPVATGNWRGWGQGPVAGSQPNSPQVRPCFVQGADGQWQLHKPCPSVEVLVSARQAISGWPNLDGQYGASGNRYARTVLGKLADGQMFVYVTPSASIQELFGRLPLNTVAALNLDGGSSTGLWSRDDNGMILGSGERLLPNLICINPTVSAEAGNVAGAEDAAGAGDVAEPIGIPNFRVVDNGIYAGAQPVEAGYNWLAGRGVQVVIDLQSGDRSAEQQWVESNGMRYLNIPMHAETPLAPNFQETMQRLLQVITDPANQPVFLHCAHGAHRTGMVVGIYRVTMQSWSFDQAWEEMLVYASGSFPYEHLEAAVRQASQ